jgi:cytochrome c-type biogenesis protein CcmE
MMWSFGQAMVPYVKMSQARLGGYCQVTAKVVHSTRQFDSAAKTNLFYIEDDKGDRLKVSYHRPLPANFDKVKQVSVKGLYKDMVFEADEVLTK